MIERHVTLTEESRVKYQDQSTTPRRPMMKMKHLKSCITAAVVLVPIVTTMTANAQMPPEITTPDRVESRLGTLTFKDGIPDNATAQKLFDELDYVHAVEAVIDGYAAVNQLSLLKGFRAAGVNDNEVLVTPGLMDAKSFFLRPTPTRITFGRIWI